MVMMEKSHNVKDKIRHGNEHCWMAIKPSHLFTSASLQKRSDIKTNMLHTVLQHPKIKMKNIFLLLLCTFLGLATAADRFRPECDRGIVKCSTFSGPFFPSSLPSTFPPLFLLLILVDDF